MLMLVTLFKPNVLPKAASPNTITLGIKDLTYESLAVVHNSVHSILVTLLYFKVTWYRLSVMPPTQNIYGLI